MSKFPIKNIILAIIFSLILVLPYQSIISSKIKQEKNVNFKTLKKSELSNSSKINVFIILSAIHKPKIIKIFQNKKLIATTTESDFESESVFHFVKKKKEKYLEFNIYAEWSKNIERSALKIEIEPENLQSRSLTLWADGFLDESITFKWIRN